MLPDFKKLQQQPQDRKEIRSLKPSSDATSSQSRNLRKSKKKRDRTSKKSKKQIPPPFVYVTEAYDEFLALWPNRFDYLFAPHPDPGAKPDWKTESSHPLSDRLILQGAYLYGVRPSSQTSYALLDIDRGSPYHPQNNPLALHRICRALERLGLISHLPLISSDSEGVHLYFPISAPLPSWKLAIGVAALLENAGFKIRPGWLEVFPNRKSFATNGNISNFQGHRLPLQPGSYLLNEDLQPIASSPEIFVRHWNLAADHNDIDLEVLEQTIKQTKRHSYRVTGKADKFLNDLNAEIESGWTGKGQTDHLLGRITMRSYIFGHILYADSPLTGKALTDDIVRIAKSLPGYKDYCGHQHEIRKRAKEWTKSIQESHYFHYGTGKALKLVDDGPTWNQKQEIGARERVQQAVVALCKTGDFPEDITPRFELLCGWGISGSTIYKHKDLWHPRFISEHQQALINPPYPPVLQIREGAACAEGAAPSEATSLLGGAGCKRPHSSTCSFSDEPKNGVKLQTGCKSPHSSTYSHLKGVEEVQDNERHGPPEQLALNIRWALQVRKAEQQAKAAENKRKHDRDKRKRSQADYRAELEGWVASGEPVLAAEARRILSRMDSSERASPGSHDGGLANSIP